jgi:hypothetical protein
VAEEQDGSALLVIVEPRPWGADPGQPDQLKAKLNTYAQYVLDCELVRHYPQLAERHVAIRLECIDDPPEVIQKIANTAAERLAEYEVIFTVKVNPRL